MRTLYTELILLLWLSVSFFQTIEAQNIDYQAEITTFYASDCLEVGSEERTWNGWLSDDENPSETYSGCVTCITSLSSCTETGTYAVRNRNNVAATSIQARIDAWEDDNGSSCQFSDGGPFGNSDDCRVQQTIVSPFTDPLEYQPTSSTALCGTSSTNLSFDYSYQYATTSLDQATEYLATTLEATGNRPFWGARGEWGFSGADCAASGTIADNQTSGFRTTVSCKSSVTFRWRVQSQFTADYLGCYINGQLAGQISGSVPWTSVTFPLQTGTPNTVEWRYSKNGSGSLGADRGWIDNIQFANATSIEGGQIEGNQEICTGGNPTNISSVAPAESFSATINYQWQFSNNQTSWTNIGGANGLSYNPPANLISDRFYRRRAIDLCGLIAYSNTVFVNVNPLPNGSLSSNQSAICPGDPVSLIFTATVGVGPYDLSINGVFYNNLPNSALIPVNPSQTTTYTISSLLGDNGCLRNSGFPGSVTITVNQASTAPTSVSASTSLACPNTTTTLTASGGVAGTGSVIRWYDGPNGTGNLVGSGNSVTVAPSQTKVYYLRREGSCNTSGDFAYTLIVRRFSYASAGTTSSVGYCTDDSGMHHFYNAQDDIMLSLTGDLSGATTDPVATINNNGSFYQNSLGGPGNCNAPGYPGEERFELPRSWNIEFSGTVSPSYTLRMYQPVSEITTMATAANNHITANPGCEYTYKYAQPNGLRFFKNSGGTYVAPQYDLPTELNHSSGVVNGIEYVDIFGINDFSGGSGGIILLPNPALPVEWTSFTGKAISKQMNRLEWETASESGSDYFVVERRLASAADFIPIGRVAAAGESNTPRRYDFEDSELTEEATHYYRLRQVDLDGGYAYSEMVVIHNENGHNGEMSVYPNPVSTNAELRFVHQQRETVTVALLSGTGKQLRSWSIRAKAGDNRTVLDLTDLPSGVYLVALRDAKGQSIGSRRLIKR